MSCGVFFKKNQRLKEKKAIISLKIENENGPERLSSIKFNHNSDKYLIYLPFFSFR